MNKNTYALLLACAGSIFLNACSPKVIPLKSNYSNGVYETTSDNDFNKIWDNLVSFFAKSGIGIRVIDKSSGLIVATKTAMPVTSENAKGSLKDSTAWVVGEKIYDPGPKKYYVANVTDAEWNVHIMKDPANPLKTLINVNLITPYATATDVISGGIFMPTYRPNLRCRIKSTGVFEKLIADKIK